MYFCECILHTEMLLSELSNIVSGELLVGEPKMKLEEGLKACASDLMSDVLTLDDHKMVLITGLNNPQTVRTAEIAEINTIVFVRGKKPLPAMRELAKLSGINLITSEKSMFHVCGLLYQSGIKPVY